MWEYLAGLFDGDGSFTISKNEGRGFTSVSIAAQLGSKNQEAIKIIISFLKSEGLLTKNHAYWNKTKDSGFGVLRISAKHDLKCFTEKIQPYLIMKKPQSEIILESIRMKEELKKDKNKTIKDNLLFFDLKRRELHKLSMKGPRKLKDW